MLTSHLNESSHCRLWGPSSSWVCPQRSRLTRRSPTLASSPHHRHAPWVCLTRSLHPPKSPGQSFFFLPIVPVLRPLPGPWCLHWKSSRPHPGPPPDWPLPQYCFPAIFFSLSSFCNLAWFTAVLPFSFFSSLPNLWVCCSLENPGRTPLSSPVQQVTLGAGIFSSADDQAHIQAAGPALSVAPPEPKTINPLGATFLYPARDPSPPVLAS